MKPFLPALLAFVSFFSVPCLAAEKKTGVARPKIVKDNNEAARLYAEDQSDRQPSDGKPIDGSVVGPRDELRRKRVMELYTAGELKTGIDYFHAAMIFQHGGKPEDYLLSHELSVAAVFMNGRERASWLPTAKWLAAASHDRFLVSIGRGQRFGTQLTKVADGPWILDKIDEGVSDELRKAWNVPSLAKAKESEAEHNKNE